MRTSLSFSERTRSLSVTQYSLLQERLRRSEVSAEEQLALVREALNSTSPYGAASFNMVKTEIADVVKRVPGVKNHWRGGPWYLDLHPLAGLTYSNAALGKPLLRTAYELFNLVGTLVQHPDHTKTPERQFMDTLAQVRQTPFTKDGALSPLAPVASSLYHYALSAADPTQETATQKLKELYPFISELMQGYRTVGHELGKSSLSFSEFLGVLHPKNGYLMDVKGSLRQEYEQTKKPHDPENFERFLEKRVKQRLELAPYQLVNFGDFENRRFTASYVYDELHTEAQGQQKPSIIRPEKEQVLYGPGLKYLWSSLCFATMTVQKGDRVESTGGLVILPHDGYYQSLESAPAFYQGKIMRFDLGCDPGRIPAGSSFPMFDEKTLASHLPADRPTLLILTNPNNPNGKIYTKRELERLGSTVLSYNKTHSEAPILVVEDWIYKHSATGKNPQPTLSIFSVVPELQSYGWVLLAPSKTFGAATIREASLIRLGDISEKSSANDIQAYIEARVRYKGNMDGVYHTNPVTREVDTALHAMVNRRWIKTNNQHFNALLNTVGERVAAINDAFGSPLLDFARPEGGWYFVLSVDREKLPKPLQPVIRSSMDLFHYFNHAKDAKGTPLGVILFPGVAMGYREEQVTHIDWKPGQPLTSLCYTTEPSRYVQLRGTVGMQKTTSAETMQEVMETFDRLEHMVLGLKSLSPEQFKDITQNGKLSLEQLYSLEQRHEIKALPLRQQCVASGISEGKLSARL